MAGIRAGFLVGTLIAGLALVTVHEPAQAMTAGATSHQVAAVRGDVTGDGIPDLISSSAGRLLADWGKAPDIGGGIHVTPGGASFPALRTAFITQDTGIISGVGEAGDGFGFALATGDFDGDGHADVAIGSPFEEAGNVKDAGRVTVLYGTSTYPYLEPRGLSDIVQGLHGIPGGPETDDRFGSTLATGDFNADGYADLAIGAPYEDIGTVDNTGAIQVLYGKATDGLTVSGLQVIENGIARTSRHHAPRER